MFYCVFLCAKLCQGLVSGSGGVEKIPSVQRNVLAKRRLVQLVNNRAKLLALCSCILTHLRNQEMILFAFQNYVSFVIFFENYNLNVGNGCMFFLTILWRYHRDMLVCDLAPPRVLHIVLHSHWPQRLASARLQRSAVSHSSLLQSAIRFGLFLTACETHLLLCV